MLRAREWKEGMESKFFDEFLSILYARQMEIQRRLENAENPPGVDQLLKGALAEVKNIRLVPGEILSELLKEEERMEAERNG